MSEGCWLHRLERRGERDHWYNGEEPVPPRVPGKSWVRHLQPRPTAAALNLSF